LRARVGFVVLAAAGLTGLVVRDLGLAASLEAWALATATALAIGWGIAGAAALLRIGSGGRLARDVAAVLAAGLVGFAVVAARLHFGVFGVPLDGETLGFAWEGVTAREVRLPVGPLVAGAALGVALLAGAAVLLRRLGGDTGPARHGTLWLLVLASAAFVAVEPRLFAPHAEDTARLRTFLPWQEPRSERHMALAALAPRQDDGRVLRLERSAIDTRFEGLRSARDALLAAPPEPASRPSLLFVVMESFRADLVDPRSTPFLASLASRCASPEYHFATGANTESGLFGLLNGLSMHYYWHFKESFDPPLPLALLGRWGYRRSLYRTFDLGYTDLGQRFLSREIDRDRAATRDDPVARDREIADALIADLEAAGAAGPPRFDLIVTYATHWNYHYPPEYGVFEPVAPETLRVRNATSEDALREHAEGLHNRQRNAAAYTDAIVAEVFAALRRSGRSADTIAVVTGDHGEAFFEHGRLGHTWSLENEMIRVPLFVCTPDARATAYRFSDHSDVFPTLFDWMGARVATAAVVTGKSLFDYRAERDVALAAVPRRRAAMRMAVIGEPYKVEFLPFGPLRPVSVSDLEDRPVTSPGREAVSRLLRAALAARDLE